MEHGIYCYYGRLGSGKTYAMTRDIIDYLNDGNVVYANYSINWKGFDEKDDLMALFIAILGLKRTFYHFPASNLRKIATDNDFHKVFGQLSSCIVAIDEAYTLFDSYQMAKMPMSERLNILQTRKFDRSILYTAQRPTSVHVVMRGMTNVFYKCSRKDLPFCKLFNRMELDLASDENVDENNVISNKIYFGQKKYYNMYNTRETVGIGGILTQNQNESSLAYGAYKMSYFDILKRFWVLFRNRLPFLRKATCSEPKILDYRSEKGIEPTIILKNKQNNNKTGEIPF